MRNRISMQLPILYFNNWSQVDISKILSLKIVFILANSADSNEMPLYAAFHLGLHCMPKYSSTSIHNEKG